MPGPNYSIANTPFNQYYIPRADLNQYVLTGSLWGWGDNQQGQLGNNNQIGRSSPVQTVSGGTNWKQVSGLMGVAAGIKTDGALWMWGNGTRGSLGDNTTISKSSPVQTVAAGTNWNQVAVGGVENNFAFAASIKTSGELWTWGTNAYYGVLGDNTLINRSSPIQTIAAGTNWRQVAAGSSSVYCIKTDGTLWTWGQNNHGQLGDNTTVDKSSPIQTVAGGTDWKQVAAAIIYSAAAIKTDGTLWTWGRNNYGQLGNNTSNNRSSPIQTVAGGTNWRQVAGGRRYFAAVKTDNTLWSWGNNNYGQLGDNTVVERSSPVQTVASGRNWQQVSCGDTTAGATKTDGTLWLWGSGTNGALANNTAGSTRVSSPVQTVNGGSNWKSVAGASFSAGVSSMYGIYFYDAYNLYPS
jgi:alpha-tubulin suppressor-like RCC1 family protein